MLVLAQPIIVDRFTILKCLKHDLVVSSQHLGQFVFFFDRVIDSKLKC